MPRQKRISPRSLTVNTGDPRLDLAQDLDARREEAEVVDVDGEMQLFPLLVEALVRRRPLETDRRECLVQLEVSLPGRLLEAVEALV